MIHTRAHIVVILGISFWGMLSATHAFYISILDIQYHKTEQKLELRYKIFTDDLESGVRSWDDTPISLQDGISLDEQERINRFLQAKTQVKLNKQVPELVLISCKNEGEATFILFSGVFENTPSLLEVQTSLLVDVFPLQRNVVRYKEGEMQRMLTLGKKKERGEVKLAK